MLDGGQDGGAIVNVAPQPIGGGEHVGQQIVHLETVEFLQALLSRTGEQILDHHLDLLLVLLVHDEIAISVELVRHRAAPSRSAKAA